MKLFLDTYNVFDEVGDSQLAQRPQGKPSDSGVLVLAVLGQQVDGQQGQVRVVLCICCDVQIQHLLQDHILTAGHRACHDLHDITRAAIQDTVEEAYKSVGQVYMQCICK